MAAFVVFVRDRIKDQSEMDTYTAKAGPSLEGPEIEGAVIVSFPTFEEAKAWYDSPAYKEAREHRFKGADYRVDTVVGSDLVLQRGGKVLLVDLVPAQSTTSTIERMTAALQR